MLGGSLGGLSGLSRSVGMMRIWWIAGGRVHCDLRRCKVQVPLPEKNYADLYWCRTVGSGGVFEIGRFYLEMYHREERSHVWWCGVTCDCADWYSS